MINKQNRAQHLLPNWVNGCPHRPTPHQINEHQKGFAVHIYIFYFFNIAFLPPRVFHHPKYLDAASVCRSSPIWISVNESLSHLRSRIASSMLEVCSYRASNGLQGCPAHKSPPRWRRKQSLRAKISQGRWLISIHCLGGDGTCKATWRK